MKSYPILLCGLLSLAAQARASELYVPEQYLAPPASASPSLSRAQVRQDTLRALKAGEVQFGDVDRTPSAATPSTLVRADVRRETVAALAAHRVTFGDVDAPAAVAAAPQRTRKDVREELFAARKSDAWTATVRTLYAN